MNELSTVFTTSTRTATQRPQQQPQQQTQIVTGAPIRGPQPDEVLIALVDLTLFMLKYTFF